jgi:membrane-associated phospholipid phosphatase
MVSTTLLALALLATTADGGSELNRVGPVEGALIGALAAGAVLALQLKPPATARWSSGVLFDDGTRDLLRASTPQARSNAGTASDFAYASLALYPLVIDAGLVAWLGKRDGDLALQLALIDAEAIAIDGLLTALLQRSFGRARPFTRDCATNPRPECNSDANTSFVSGHASVAFTAATTMCMQHARLSLYGAGDAAVCPVALTVATATGALRIVADKHYASDVIAGAALGALVGIAVNAVHLHSRDGVHGISATPEGRGAVYVVRF